MKKIIGIYLIIVFILCVNESLTVVGSAFPRYYDRSAVACSAYSSFTIMLYIHIAK